MEKLRSLGYFSRTMFATDKFTCFFATLRPSVTVAAVFLGMTCFLTACSTGDEEGDLVYRGTIESGRDPGNFKNIVIFLVDTLRADRLGIYGYGRNTSPNIDAFAADSVVFDSAFSVSPWTRTSVASMFTSMYPVAHKCQDEDDLAGDELVMMAEILKANGFKTGGFSTNISVSKKFNMTQGFENFVYFEREPWLAANSDRPDPGYVPIEFMMTDTTQWLDRTGEDPFFLYFHSTDPHWQYRAPAEFEQWGNQSLGDLYDAEVRYTDHYFAVVTEHLRKLGKLDETLFIFTADHGEELFDHGGHGHGHTLFNELLRVPLLFRHPDLRPGRRSEAVRLVDVLPTIVELFSLDAKGAQIQGRSLMPLLFGGHESTPVEQFVLGEVMYPSKIEGISLESDGWKLIQIFQMQRSRGFPAGLRDSWMLFNTRQDPYEQKNVADAYPALRVRMASTMVDLRKQFDAPAVEGKDAELDEKTREALRSLGYVE